MLKKQYNYQVYKRTLRIRCQFKTTNQIDNMAKVSKLANVKEMANKLTTQQKSDHLTKRKAERALRKVSKLD